LGFVFYACYLNRQVMQLSGMRLSGLHVLYFQKQYSGNHLKGHIHLKTLNFSYPAVFDGPSDGDPTEFCQDLWHKKTEMTVLPGNKIILCYVLPLSSVLMSVMAYTTHIP